MKSESQKVEIEYYDDDTFVNKKIKKKKKNLSENHQEIKIYYKNGNIENEYFLLYGKVEGDSISRFDNEYNTKSYHYSYKNGKLEGLFQEFYDTDGEFIKSKGYYKNDKLEGKYFDYYESGEESTNSYYKNDKLEGEYRTYYKNGNGKEECCYKRNKIEGIYKKRYNSDQLEIQAMYVKGIIVNYKEFYPSGSIKCLKFCENILVDKKLIIENYKDGEFEFIIMKNQKLNNDLEINFGY